MKAIGPLVGFVMRETKGRADGGEVTADPRAARRRRGRHGLGCRDRRRRLRGRLGGAGAGAAVAAPIRRLTLVNDVNFLLYTPFLPEAAAGTSSRVTW